MNSVCGVQTNQQLKITAFLNSDAFDLLLEAWMLRLLTCVMLSLKVGVLEWSISPPDFPKTLLQTGVPPSKEMPRKDKVTAFNIRRY
jgi:hypothetical protein